MGGLRCFYGPRPLARHAAASRCRFRQAARAKEHSWAGRAVFPQSKSCLRSLASAGSHASHMGAILAECRTDAWKQYTKTWVRLTQIGT